MYVVHVFLCKRRVKRGSFCDAIVLKKRKISFFPPKKTYFGGDYMKNSIKGTQNSEISFGFSGGTYHLKFAVEWGFNHKAETIRGA